MEHRGTGAALDATRLLLQASIEDALRKAKQTGLAATGRISLRIDLNNGGVTSFFFTLRGAAKLSI